mgnify:CR=1 FL=1
MATHVKLASPWVQYYREIEALFGDDPDIKVLFDEDDLVVRLSVNDHDKADALTQLLPASKEFGNVTLYISVIPNNEVAAPSKISLLKRAFHGNPAFCYTASAEGLYSSPIHYVVFANQVVQYFNDDLGDINGFCSTLYQDIAKDVLGESEGVHYCTNTPAE